MADFSIDQNRLPGVKEVCRDFAVLEDHCLAHNLQEQEIESHLASNINRSRLVQQDLLVAKRLQEEEDLRAKEKQKKQHHDLEQIDSEMAHVIQEQLVRQAEQQRQQEEKDEAIARRLQEKEKKRQKQLEARVEEEYYDEKGAHRIPSDSGYPSPEYSRKKQLDAGRRRYPEYDPPEQGSPRRHESPGLDRYQDRRGRNPDYWPLEGRQRQIEQRGGHRASEEDWEDKLVVRKKDKPSRPPPPKYPTERDRDQDRERKRDKERGTERGERDGERDGHRTQSRDRLEMREADRDRDRERRRDKERGRVGQRDGERDGHRTRSRDRLEMREPDRDRDREAERDRHGHWRREDYNRSREQNGDRDRDGGRDCKESRNGHRDRDGDRDGDRVVYMYETRDGVKKHHNGRMRSRDMEHEERTGSWSGDEEPRNHLRLPSDPGEVFEEPIYPRSPKREALDLDSDVQRGRTHSRDLYSFSDSPLDRGRGGRGDFGVVEAQQALSRMALREQELQEMRDMEVARQLQEHELKASQMNQRAAQAAQVAQDEEIARMLMEEEKKVFKKAREREREKAPVDRRKPEADWRPSQEEALQPRSREEYDPQRARHQKPSRPAPPHTQNYENVQAGYGYPEPHYPARPATRPDIAYKGSYYKQ